MQKISLVLLVCAGIFLRLYSIDCEYGTDALSSINKAKEINSEILYNYFFGGNLNLLLNSNYAELAHNLLLTMPGYSAVLKVAMILGVENDALLRALTAALPGILLIILTLLFSYRIWGARTSIIITSLTVTSPLLQYYSNYIRFYSLLCLLSAATLYLSIYISKNRETLHSAVWLILSALLFLNPFVHISGILSSLICLGVIISSQDSGIKIPKLFWFFTIPLLSIISLNSIYFISARFLDQTSINNVMSQSFISFLSSIFFNFNPLLMLIVFTYILNCIAKRKRIDFLYYSWLGAFLIIFILSVFRHDLFRPDYLASLLPLTFLLASLIINQLIENSKDKLISGLTLTGGIIMISLPSLISNAFIDQDRFSYKEALSVLQKNLKPEDKAIIYTLGQDRFSKYIYGSDITFKNLNEIITPTEPHFNRIFYLLPWGRQGFGKDFMLLNVWQKEQAEKIKQESRLIKVIGKSRLDLKDNLLFLFERLPDGNS